MEKNVKTINHRAKKRLENHWNCASSCLHVCVNFREPPMWSFWVLAINMNSDFSVPHQPSTVHPRLYFWWVIQESHQICPTRICWISGQVLGESARKDYQPGRLSMLCSNFFESAQKNTRSIPFGMKFCDDLRSFLNQKYDVLKNNIHLEPQTTIYKWLFQLDDSKSLYRKWLEITKHPFINGCFNWMIPNLYIENGCFTKHPFINGCLGFQAKLSRELQ